MPSKAMAPIIKIALYTAWQGKLKETGLKYLKGEVNFQNNLSWLNTGPPLFSKYIGEKAHNAPKVKLSALK